jgi:hypothetical protein
MIKKAFILSLFCTMSFAAVKVNAQCSVCTKTVAQMGEKPARGLNQGILYLMGAPFAIMGIIGYRWWKSQKGTSV